jgi:hypothetical protein
VLCLWEGCWGRGGEVFGTVKVQKWSFEFWELLGDLGEEADSESYAASLRLVTRRIFS